MDPYTIKKRLVLQRKELLLERLCDLWYVKKDELEKKVTELSDRIVNKIAETNQLKEYYRQARKEGKEQETHERSETADSLTQAQPKKIGACGSICHTIF